MTSSIQNRSGWATVQRFLQAAGVEAPPNLAEKQKIQLSPEDAAKVEARLTDRYAAGHVGEVNDVKQAIVKCRDVFEVAADVGGAFGTLLGNRPNHPVGTVTTENQTRAGVGPIPLDEAQHPDRPVSVPATQAEALLEAIKKAPADLKAAIAAMLQGATANGDIQAKDDARKAYTKTIAEGMSTGQLEQAQAVHSAPALPETNYVSNLFKPVRFFEDLIAAFMFEFAAKMQQELKDQMDEMRRSDPQVPKFDRIQTLRSVLGQMPPGVVDVAARSIAANQDEILAALPQNDPMRDVLSEVAKRAQSGEPMPVPAVHSDIAQAMLGSKDKDVRLFGLITDMQVAAQRLESVPTTAGGYNKLNDRQLEQVKADYATLTGHMDAAKPALMQMLVANGDPASLALAKQIEEMPKLPPLPQSQDANSRALMMEQVRMATNQYQQVMQALSQILGAFDDLAKNTIRKIGQ